MPRKDPEARREYQREYQRQWYQKNRAVHLARVTRVNQRVREALKKYVDQLKEQPCADCGGQFPAFIMDFDHVRGIKFADISRFRCGRLAWAKLQAEVEKCEVVCANCHRVRTQLRLRGIEVRASEIVKALGTAYVSVLVY